ncbi:ABC transporter ATP-binding protein [Dongia sp.]|uniref:ABC transporter ATP-binding protein n=1 Tax=Dongia sp. TaxID=1977262 RepID=UPI0035B2236E
MAFLELTEVRKAFNQNVVVQNFNLAVERGEFISFLGPSGCGKTTTLRMIAGFELPSSGSITIDGKDITHLRPNQRNVGMVFQSYALFPNMTVAQNVAFGLKVAKWQASEIGPRVEEMLNIIKLPHLADRYPYQLSGGQQQRVALARALAVKPQVLLLDEPLSALDAKIRVSLRDEIRSLQRKLGITTIYVTHDQEEALSMSDRIVVMTEGRVDQVGVPFEIYNNPKTRFVANFVGTLSVLNGTVADATTLDVGGQKVTIGAGLAGRAAGSACAVALRPEVATLEGYGGQGATANLADRAVRNRLNGKIEDVAFLGSVIRIKVRIGSDLLSLDTFNNPAVTPPEHGSDAVVTFSPADVLVLEEK